ncbi:MAG: SPOR domain-containing protein [Thermoanaerobaculia bacterium]|nr:SPOR domain-containing protein [Thermoanaerobaculia bacterium]
MTAESTLYLGASYLGPRKRRFLGSLLGLALLSADVGSAGSCGTTPQEISPGLIYSTLCLGHAATTEQFRVIVGSFESQGEADRILASLKAPAVREEYGDRAFVQFEAGEYRVGFGGFADLPEAEEASTDLAVMLGVPLPEVETYSQDLTHADGPWVVDLLEVDPRRVRVEVAHAYDSAIGLETTRSLA